MPVPLDAVTKNKLPRHETCHILRVARKITYRMIPRDVNTQLLCFRYSLYYMICKSQHSLFVIVATYDI